MEGKENLGAWMSVLLCLLCSSALSSAPVCHALRQGANPNGLSPELLPSAFWLACAMGGSRKEGGRHRERSGYLCHPAPACLATVTVVSLPVARARVSALPFALLGFGVVMTFLSTIASP